MMESYEHVVYTLKCCDGTFYTGYTNNLLKRMTDHQQGRGAKYTRGRRPVVLVHLRGFASKKEAMQAEYRFKQLTRAQKAYYIEKEGIQQEASGYVDSTKLS